MRHMDVGIDMIIMPAMQHCGPPGDLAPRVFNVGGHDGCDDGPPGLPVQGLISAFC